MIRSTSNIGTRLTLPAPPFPQMEGAAAPKDAVFHRLAAQFKFPYLFPTLCLCQVIPYPSGGMLSSSNSLYPRTVSLCLL